jgi:hypothetical protein
MDTWQTWKFRQEGRPEANPIFAPLINRDDDWWIPVSLVGAYILDSKIKNDRNRDHYYAAWALWHIAAIEGNRKRTGRGFPILLLSWKL